MPGLSASQTNMASSESKLDYKGTTGQSITSESQAQGNRGYINNVSFPGSVLSTDQGINPPAMDVKKSGSVLMVLGMVALTLLVLWRFLKH